MTKVAILFDKNNLWIRKFFSDADFRDLPDYKVEFFEESEKVTGNHIVFVLGYTKILSENFLNRNELNLIVHESALPEGKGFSPVQWQILEGKNKIPICLLEMNNSVDSGNIIMRSDFVLNGYELYDEIRNKQANATKELITKFLEVYPNFTRQNQIGSETFYSKRTDSDSELNINKTIAEQFDLLRVVNNEKWPSFFMKDGKKYILKIYRD